MEILIIVVLAAAVIGLLNLLVNSRNKTKSITAAKNPPITEKKDPPPVYKPPKKPAQPGENVIYKYTPERGGRWVCKHCETENSAAVMSCSVCHAKR